MHPLGLPYLPRLLCRFGITTFVYSRRRPFHPQRLKETVLQWMPVSHNAEVKPGDAAANESPIKTVMRSKGFAWLAHGHASAYYWSHAGQHFEMRYPSPPSLLLRDRRPLQRCVEPLR